MITRVAVLLLAVVAVSHANNYCNIKSCNGRPHTACTFSSPQPSQRCKKEALYSASLTAEEKRKVLDAHNRLRQKVASGQETRGNPGPQPKAKHMPNLEWDNELEVVAQRWANQCDWGHDTCRDVERFQVGQNLAYSGTTANVNNIDVESMVQSWYDEVKDFNKNDVTRFKSTGGPVVGHYTQLVWAKTTKVGCGATKYKEGQFNKFYLVCNYAPTGNWIGQPIYLPA